MDREEALRLLLGGPKGVAEWNRHHVKHQPRYRGTPQIVDLSQVELNGADLHGAKLAGARLSEADLSFADLGHADLRLAELPRANLSNAILRGADLSRADLRGADFTRANLSEADLREADLLATDFYGADLSGAELSNARASQTRFASDLSQVKGLDAVFHDGPSTVSIESLLSFHDVLPETFLRGCGLRNQEIDYFRSQLGAIHFYSCFISYSTKDGDFARRLHNDLQGRGVRCWYAPEDLKIGDRPLAKINDAIRLREKLVLILSEASINSDWVEHEVNEALAEEERRGKDVLFPMRLDEAVMTCEFGWARRLREAHKPHGRHIGDFTGWKNHDVYQAAFQRLLRDLKQTRGA